MTNADPDDSDTISDPLHPTDNPTFNGEPVAGRYRLGPILGQGRQGRTHLALDQTTEEWVAVKVFDLATAETWKDFELFERECRVLRTLNHEDIPQFRGRFESEDGQRGFLVMDYVPGVPLSQALTDGGLDEARVWSILGHVLPTLAYLHTRPTPVIHRDIKPANVIERPDGGVVLVDFGGARLHRRDQGSTIIGTFGYLAPEQLYGDATPRTDLYSLGATMVALATGRQPESLPRKGLAIDLESALPRVSPHLRWVLGRMLAPDPAHRPSSAAALLADLQTGKQRSRNPSRPMAPVGRAMTRWRGPRLGVIPVVPILAMFWLLGAAPPTILVVLMAFALISGGRRGRNRWDRGRYRRIGSARPHQSASLDSEPPDGEVRREHILGLLREGQATV